MNGSKKSLPLRRRKRNSSVTRLRPHLDRSEGLRRLSIQLYSRTPGSSPLEPSQPTQGVESTAMHVPVWEN